MKWDSAKSQTGKLWGKRRNSNNRQGGKTVHKAKPAEWKKQRATHRLVSGRWRLRSIHRNHHRLLAVPVLAALEEEEVVVALLASPAGLPEEFLAPPDELPGPLLQRDSLGSTVVVGVVVAQAESEAVEEEVRACERGPRRGARWRG